MGWESFGVVRFDLGPLLQGQTSIAKLKSSITRLLFFFFFFFFFDFFFFFIDLFGYTTCICAYNSYIRKHIKDTSIL